MQLAITTLERESVENITHAFNEAFSDYFIPLQLTAEQMRQKMRSEGIQLPYSIGAFNGEKLVGFILHGLDEISGEMVIYNGGTGVIPSHRGHGITTAMYRFAIPRLQKDGIKKHLLEVIDGNAPAKHSYEKVGFRDIRKLSAFRNNTSVPETNAARIEVLDEVPNVNDFGDAQPTWQNNVAAILRDKGQHTILGAYSNNELAGYAIYATDSGRVKQIGVKEKYRRQKIGSTLMHYIKMHTPASQLLFSNVDNRCGEAFPFLESLGFEKILELYEMEMKVD
ncbi:MAG: GNAT family N-acetyltransferase [Flavisolibacter sp.]